MPEVRFDVLRQVEPVEFSETERLLPEHPDVPPPLWHQRAIKKIDQCEQRIPIPGITIFDAHANRLDNMFRGIIDSLRGHLKQEFNH